MVTLISRIRCLKDYYSPLDRSQCLLRKDWHYLVHETRAEGFYAVDVEDNKQGLTRIAIQTNDPDFLFIDDHVELEWVPYDS